MVFSAADFVASPDKTELDNLRKPDLIELGKHLGLDVKISMRKQEIKNLVIQHMINEEIVDVNYSDLIIQLQPDALEMKRIELEYQLKLKQLQMQEGEKERDREMQQLQMQEREKEREMQEREKEREMQEREKEREMQQLQMQEREKDREMEEREREREHQFKLKQLELSGVSGSVFQTQSNSDTNFDAAKNIRLVPKFQETEVDKYFLHFEKIAANLKWPKTVWTLLLQSVLIGRAREIFSAMSIEQSQDYDVVKQAILKAYELVPEAYRQKFRNTRKLFGQTHVEFARQKERLFDRWLTSKDVNQNFDKLRHLILLEEFQQCVHLDIRTYLDEHKAETLAQAATMADDYALTHKLSLNNQSSPSTGFKPYFNQSTESPARNSFKLGYSQDSFRPYRRPDQVTPQFLENFKQRSDLDKGKLPVKDKPSELKASEIDKGTPLRSVPTCSYCKKKGHIISECWVLKRKNEQKVKTYPNACSAIKSTLQPLNNAEPQLKRSESEFLIEDYKPFISKGFVSLIGDNANLQPITILRDTGASQSLLLEGILPLSEKSSAGADVLIQGVELGFVRVPLHNINLKSDLISGPVSVGVRPTLPVEGVSLLLGNDLAGDKVLVNPIVSDQPCVDEVLEQENCEIFPSCAVTRAMSKKLAQDEASVGDQPFVDLDDTFFANMVDNVSHDSNEIKSHDEQGSDDSNEIRSREEQSSDSLSSVPSDKLHNTDSLSTNQLIIAQANDPELKSLIKKSLSLAEANKVPVCYFKQNGILMRKWRPVDASADDEWQVVHQIVVPKVYRQEILNLAHDSPMSGHLGVNKTYNKIINHFFWPNLRHDVAEYCKSCHTCQVVGKPNQKIPIAPLRPIPAFNEPFSRIIVDCVGPLPKTRSGNQYLLTIMCASTRFPEAIPLRNITASNVVKALTKFFTLFGLPQSIQSDQGTNFMSNLFQQVMHHLGIKQFKSSAYHPESQGALERFHQTLKNMIRTYCLEFQKDWDEGVHLLLFATREAVQESLGFSPFELVFGHSVRGPLKLLKEKWLCEDTTLNILDYVSKFKEKLLRATEIAQQNLKKTQTKMKQYYDKDARSRTFQPGDKVLAFLPIPGHSLQARYFGPYEVESKINDLNYVIKTPGRRKQRQFCHINMLKAYIERDNTDMVKPIATLATDQSRQHLEEYDIVEQMVESNIKLRNSDVLSDLNTKLNHLSSAQQTELKNLINQFKHLFPDVPSKTNIIYHDVDVNGALPIKQHPYRLSPEKLEHLRKEVKYMLENDIIEPCSSGWSSPCVLVPKPDRSYRFCTDFRKVNAVTKTDSFPIPRIDDCIDRIGQAKFVTKFDLLKGYWQVPLTERAKEVSAFVTPDGLYRYKVMPFGMKNSPATFQRLMNSIVSEIDSCECYIDDVIIYSKDWSEHLKILTQFFQKVSKANLTINLLKSEFCKATVEYLGHIVGQGQIKPVAAKVESIIAFPAPTNKKEMMRFLGMAGYYRKFCPNFSTIASSLTALLKKDTKFYWSEQCQLAFNRIKAILSNSPVLIAPNFSKQFKIAVDASDVGIGAVLMQEGTDKVDHPVCYFSRKFNKHQQNYSTIEKECLALLLALQHFDVYLGTTLYPISVFTDHNPLTFIHKIKNKNQRLLRWCLILQEYNLDIKHIKGKDNVIADALSRAG